MQESRVCGPYSLIARRLHIIRALIFENLQQVVVYFWIFKKVIFRVQNPNRCGQIRVLRAVRRPLCCTTASRLPRLSSSIPSAEEGLQFFNYFAPENDFFCFFIFFFRTAPIRKDDSLSFSRTPAHLPLASASQSASIVDQIQQWFDNLVSSPSFMCWVILSFDPGNS